MWQANWKHRAIVAEQRAKQAADRAEQRAKQAERDRDEARCDLSALYSLAQERLQRAQKAEARAEQAERDLRAAYERESTGETAGDAETAGKVRFRVVYGERVGFAEHRRAVTVGAPNLQSAEAIAEMGRRHGEQVLRVQPWNPNATGALA